ncbi:MAG: hypothetical protein DCC43_04240 [Candidatus Brocadia sp.]|uniref:Uncharacterized protein n=1 Tax=Candidatus Brocadia fulgida TaxID=380242 RepID=A0A0M2URR4_9BACT|nr:MAG: hypothetical protein BROFUL_02543 [Candidatus Brocadia fulgida]MCC6324664.1 hypothetical protein [Candidatus Brocadia sp.]MCE7910966.1 hypothetical protein [Candidatus Brocadia sp. AMX3]MBV6517750.1 hypothetical protein [Candidatus Brocadia fulgida]MDG5997303.1 hypothetical protein [Candidatus Brocadia sp.]
MCDVGGHVSSDMITWQCACCGTAIRDSNDPVEGLCDLGICLSCRNAPEDWLAFVSEEWEEGICSDCLSPCDLKR